MPTAVALVTVKSALNVLATPVPVHPLVQPAPLNVPAFHAYVTSAVGVAWVVSAMLVATPVHTVGVNCAVVLLMAGKGIT